MPSDFENGTRKTIDISVKAEKMTADILKSALQEFLSGKSEKKGRMTYKQLQEKSVSKLDSIEVSDRNIGNFLKKIKIICRHIMFYFSEYIGKGQGKKRGEFTREQMHQQAQKVANRPRKQKQREKTRENRR